MTTITTSSTRAITRLANRNDSSLTNLMSASRRQPRPLSQRCHIYEYHTIHTAFAQQYRSYASPPKPKAYTPPVRPITPPTPTPKKESQDVNSDATALLASTDGINGPRSTLPPDLKLPDRGDQAAPIYWFRIGRAYGSFYWAGVKATWRNHKAARALLAELHSKNPEIQLPRRFFGALSAPLPVQCERYIVANSLTRTQFQLLMRQSEDFAKLPFFALLVAAFGEWLPLIVPFIPDRVPRTCRIPKQIAGMRQKLEDRRRDTFRAGTAPPSPESLRELKAALHALRTPESCLGNAQDLTVSMTENDVQAFQAMKDHPFSSLAAHVTEVLSSEQIHHVSASLNLHAPFWDRLGLSQTSVGKGVLRWKVARRLQYLAIDDALLCPRDRTRSFHLLGREELELACEERGIDVRGLDEEVLRKRLGVWLGRPREDVCDLLFKRPNAW